MRARAWLILLAGLNFILAAGWFSYYLGTKPSPSSQPAPRRPFNSLDFHVRTNIDVRRQNFTWSEVESDDYAIYIKNLRQIGCPEETIRDIILAEVNELFNQRRNAEAVKSSFQWWRSDPDMEDMRREAQKLKSLEEERRALLTRLLGPNWDKANDSMSPSSRSDIHLEGPVLGELSSEVKQKVYDISAQARQLRNVYLQIQRQQGKQPDPAELERLRQEFRSGLGEFLNFEQMEEFLLRYSQTAVDMRKEFRGLDLTADEFRAIFRTRDPLEQQAAFLSQDDPSVARRLLSLQTQADEAVKRSLGKERFTLYKLNQDPLFGETKTAAERVGASPEVLFAMYQINQETEAERRRVRNDLNLSSEEKIDALAEIQAMQQKSLQKLLGATRFQRLTEVQEKRP